MSEAIKWYPQLKQAFKNIVPVGVALNKTQPYVENDYSLPTFEQYIGGTTETEGPASDSPASSNPSNSGGSSSAPSGTSSTKPTTSGVSASKPTASSGPNSGTVKSEKSSGIVSALPSLIGSILPLLLVALSL
ncbi:hypothetical protein VNI00_009633 [Paramarasmius palmivorus]|uniref:Uncharacterized protein n=1 Tax=Paramarasmius palmivorus TaxID=297713 RepID=A0AAW0CQG3_9AGAR